MATLKGADIIIETLLELGVDTIFGYPGGSVLNTYDAIYKYRDKITHLLCSHEQHAGHAADGYARSCGKTGVVFATSGPGATNLVTAIATANMDSVPLVAFTGNVDQSMIGKDSFQEVDITGITLPVTKHNFLVRDVKLLADTIRKAFFIANDGRKGAVLIDVPKDITAAECEFSRGNPVFHTKLVNPALESEISAAAEVISAAKEVFVYAGGGVISADASEELADFVGKTNAVVSCSLMGQGAFDQHDGRYLGILGMHGTVAASKASSECDLFVAVGARFSDRVIGDRALFLPKARIIHIDADSAEHNKNIAKDGQINVYGDAKDVLSRLNKLIEQKRSYDWREKCADYANQADLTRRQSPSVEYPVTPQEIIETLDRLTAGDAVIATEVGQNQMWAAQYFRYRKPRSFVSSGGLGTMGFGLGAAIGAKYANPGKTVINIAGDGSFGMNVGELATISRENIPVLQIVLNNGVLGMVRQWQKLFYGSRFSATELFSPVDYVKLGDAYGIKALRVTKREQIEPALADGLKTVSSGKPVMLEFVISPDMNVLPMVPAGRDITKQILSPDLGA